MNDLPETCLFFGFFQLLTKGTFPFSLACFLAHLFLEINDLLTKAVDFDFQFTPEPV
ncbi:MAG TPA: hypothetical protein V6C65_38680 [Allocoleopsis sp.]